MTDERDMTATESLEIIRSMIDKARFNFSKGSFYFIMWGVLLMGAAIYEFYMHHIQDSEWAFIAWPIVGIAGGIASTVYGRQTGRGEAWSHIDRMYTGIWVTYFVTLALFLIGSVSNSVNPGSYVMILTGFPTFLTGLVLRFRPLIIGGIGFWTLGFLSLFFMQEFTPIIFAVSMIQGYLVPGILMRTLKREHV